MAIVKPFRGIRPPKELVEKVESRPYDVLDSEEARIEAGDNEMSLYHIINSITKCSFYIYFIYIIHQ